MLGYTPHWFVAASAALVFACGGSPLVAETARGAAANMQPVHGTTVETARHAETTGGVQISDEVRAACGIADHDAYFAFDSSSLSGQDLPVLDQVAACFTSGPLAGRTVRLVGHADPRGAIDYNMTLGQARADAVALYIQRFGLTRSRLQTVSRGALDARGTDETTWQRDRRVDVLLAP
jgi:peptidoglycan-associated lipoprotein